VALELKINPIGDKTTEKEIRKLTESFGVVRKVQFMRGFKSAFVTFEDEADAEKAVEGLKGATLKGKAIEVSLTGKPQADPLAVAKQKKARAKEALAKIYGGDEKWVIQPKKGVGPLQFGMTRKEVEAQLNSKLEDKSWEKHPEYLLFNQRIMMSGNKTYSYYWMQEIEPSSKSKALQTVSDDLIAPFAIEERLQQAGIGLAFDQEEKLQGVVFYMGGKQPMLNERSLLGISQYEFAHEFAIDYDADNLYHEIVSTKSGVSVVFDRSFGRALFAEYAHEILVFSDEFQKTFFVKRVDAASSGLLRKIGAHWVYCFEQSTSALASLLEDFPQIGKLRDTKRHSLLHFLSFNREFEQRQVELLVSAGCDVNEADLDGNTPLHFARYSKFVEALCKLGANPRAHNSQGDEPIHRAAASGFVDICQELVSCGADINAKDRTGKTAWDLRPDSLEIENQLYELGARSGLGKTVRTVTESPRWEWFWEKFAANPDDSNKERVGAIEKALQGLSDEELAEFNEHLNYIVGEVSSCPIIDGFAKVLNTGGSDDSFHDFVSWVISKGRKFCEKAMKKPDLLANAKLDYEGFAFEMLTELPNQIYAKRTGKEDATVPRSKVKFLFPEISDQETRDWDWEDLKKAFPKLYAKYQ
jgi:hypothetical protein